MIDTAKTGRLISVCRKDAGLTQEELASKLGVTPQAVSRWERGSSAPDIDMLLPLAGMFKISVETLLTGEQTPYGNESGGAKSNTAKKLDINNLEITIHNELSIKFSSSICKPEDEDFNSFVQGAIDGVKLKRHELARKYGILMPVVQIRDQTNLKENEYAIYLKNKTVYNGVFYIGMSYAIVNGETFREDMDGIETIDFTGRKVRWVRDDKIPAEIKSGFKPACAMLTEHLEHVVAENFRNLVNRDMAKQLADKTAINFPVTVSEIVPVKISYAALAKLLVHILEAGKPVNDLRSILEAAEEAEDLTDLRALGEKIASGM